MEENSFTKNCCDFLQQHTSPNCTRSKFKVSSMGPGNFTTKCLALEMSFFKSISMFIHGPGHFLCKMPWFAKVEVSPGPFYTVSPLQNDL